VRGLAGVQPAHLESVPPPVTLTTYNLRFSKRRGALLLNFPAKLLTDGGIKRIVNDFPE
jgi:hypothetical protein